MTVHPNQEDFFVSRLRYSSEPPNKFPDTQTISLPIQSWPHAFHPCLVTFASLPRKWTQMVVAILIFLISANSLSSAPILWAPSVGGNGHSYEEITTESPISWGQARDAAIARGGHLATITSMAENSFVGALGNAGLRWIGGHQPVGSEEPDGGWSWVTGEPFNYNHWYHGEPNNGNGGNQNYIVLWDVGASWVDNDNLAENGWATSAYIVEYDKLELSYGLLAYYPFQGNADDASGNSRHGIASGATLTTDRFGAPNSAYLFDGVGSDIEVSNVFPMQAQQTIIAWVNPSSVSVKQTVFEKSIQGFGGEVDFQLLLGSDGKIDWMVNTDDGASGLFSLASASTPLVIDQWSCIACVIDQPSDQIRLYINGTLAASAPMGGRPVRNRNRPFRLGKGIGNQFDGHFNGKIDEVRVYDRVLFGSELATVFQDIAPAITSVSPNPVPGHNTPQPFTINGANFQQGCSVTLHNLSTGNTYQNRTKLAQTSTTITLSPTFGIQAHTWSVDVTNPNGISSGQYQFHVTAQAVLVSVIVTGPSRIAAGAQTEYTAVASFSDGTTMDVSASAAWSVAGGSGGTNMAGSKLVAGTGRARNATVLATYSDSTGTRSGTAQVAVGAGWSPVILWANATFQTGSNPIHWALDAGASNFGEIPSPVTYRWKLDNIFVGNPPGILNHFLVPGNKGSHNLELIITDGIGLTQTYALDVPFNIPAPSEPASTHAPTDPHHLATVYGSDGHLLQFDSGKTGAGFLLLSHGLKGSGFDPWLKEMARDIERRLTDEGKPLPNIAIHDWKKNADPQTATDYDSSFRNQLDSSLLFGTAHDFLGITYDFQRIEPLAKTEGLLLGCWLLQQIDAGYIDPAQPIHLIGHSAGGFVVGEAATYLKQKGYMVDLVTMLDTPDPMDRNFTDFPNPGYVERYISSALGIAQSYNRVGEHQVPIIHGFPVADLQVITALAVKSRFWDPNSSAGSSVRPNTFYRREVFPIYNEYKGKFGQTEQAHSEAHISYDSLTVYGIGHTGFWHSPFLQGVRVDKTAWNGNHAALKGAIPNKQDVMADESATLLSGFQTFGNVAPITDGYKITEQDNAGISKQMLFSYGAVALRFKYSFTSPGDGDFLAVRIGDSAPLYVAPGNELTETGFVSGEIPLGAFANTTDTIIFTLISRGVANAVVQVKDISLIESDDPDADGLTTAQELDLGADPLVYDTDGDSLSDGDETQLYYTSPVLTDTDGDSIGDAEELAAGTNPLNPRSGLVIISTQRTVEGGFTLNWSAVVGKTYRILRSTTPDFLNFDVIGAGVESSGSVAVYTDSTLPPGTPQIFYRVAVEQ